MIKMIIYLSWRKKRILWQEKHIIFILFPVSTAQLSCWHAFTFRNGTANRGRRERRDKRGRRKCAREAERERRKSTFTCQEVLGRYPSFALVHRPDHHEAINSSGGGKGERQRQTNELQVLVRIQLIVEDDWHRCSMLNDKRRRARERNRNQRRSSINSNGNACLTREVLVKYPQEGEWERKN